jgi:hypothetical protein
MKDLWARCVNLAPEVHCQTTPVFLALSHKSPTVPGNTFLLDHMAFRQSLQTKTLAEFHNRAAMDA